MTIRILLSRSLGPAWACWLVLLAVVALAPAAAAQRSPAEKAAAETLFDRGLGQLKANELTAACTSFDQSQKIDPAVGTLLYLAECYERTGRNASAWATFREAASLARELKQTDRAEVGDERARKLEPLLAHIALEPGANKNLTTFKLLHNGIVINPVLFGVATPVDPGEHVLKASADGHQTWVHNFVVTTEAAETRITLPPLAPIPPEPAVTSLQPAPVVEAPPTSKPQETTFEPIPRDQQTLAWVAGGIGLAGLGAGVVFGLRAAKLDSDAAKLCSAASCWQNKGETFSERAQKTAIFANIGYGVAVVGLATATLLFLTNDAPREMATSAILVDGSSDGGVISYQGKF